LSSTITVISSDSVNIISSQSSSSLGACVNSLLLLLLLLLRLGPLCWPVQLTLISHTIIAANPTPSIINICCLLLLLPPGCCPLLPLLSLLLLSCLLRSLKVPKRGLTLQLLLQLLLPACTAAAFLCLPGGLCLPAVTSYCCSCCSSTARILLPCCCCFCINPLLQLLPARHHVRLLQALLPQRPQLLQATAAEAAAAACTLLSLLAASTCPVFPITYVLPCVLQVAAAVEHCRAAAAG
jgi:hypothetical protein